MEHIRREEPSQPEAHMFIALEAASKQESTPKLEQPSGSGSQPAGADCKRYDEHCPCCHCRHMRQAVKRAEFLQTPEGQHQLQMKLYAKNMFMDICALAEVRKNIMSRLDGTEEYPSPCLSYPVSITKVERLDHKALCIKWFVHDASFVDHFLISVDNELRKRVHSAKQSQTILLDVDATKTHTISMKAVPSKGIGPNATPIDRLVREVCCGSMEKAMKQDYFCQCVQGYDKLKTFYKKNSCKNMLKFWKTSEFIYIPTCNCTGACNCDNIANAP